MGKPYSRQFVRTDLDTKPKSYILIQPSSQLSKILVPNSQYPTKEVAFLLVRNATDKEVVLKKNQHFGMGIEVQEVISDDESTDIQVFRVDIKDIQSTTNEWFVPYSDIR